MTLDVGRYGESVLVDGGSDGCVAVQDIDRLPCPSLTCPISHQHGKVRVGISLWLQTAARVGCVTCFMSNICRIMISTLLIRHKLCMICALLLLGAWNRGADYLENINLIANGNRPILPVVRSDTPWCTQNN